MTKEEVKDELYRMLSDVVNGSCPIRNNTQRGRYREAVKEAIEVLEQEPCDDVISREDALKALCQAVHKNDDNIPCPNQRISCLWNKTKVQDYAEEILKLPPATPQQRTGHWIITHRNGVNTYVCSECNNEPLLIGESYPIFKLSDYCPYCGIKMEVNE